MELTALQQELFSLQDSKYRDFHSSLIPGKKKEQIIGIRMPVLRRFAKDFAGRPEAGSFFTELPHYFYEENNLHMLLITAEKDFDTCLLQLKTFLPYIDNWATCDLPAPKCFARNKTRLLPEIQAWIASGQTYTIRYGIGLLMRLYLDEDFSEEYLHLAASVHSQEYYVNMMIAWYFATALARQWDAAIPCLEKHLLPEWVHQKTIQKAIESYRITPEQKDYLRTLRIAVRRNGQPQKQTETKTRKES